MAEWNLKTEIERRGVKIELNRYGIAFLADILIEGCPVKYSNHEFKPVDCRLKHGYTCESCWREFLRKINSKE